MQTFTLKTKIEDGKAVSRGLAIVQYATKEDAALAMKKLIFETSLGSMLEIDFYQSKESRLQEMEEQNNTIKQAFEMSKHL